MTGRIVGEDRGGWFPRAVALVVGAMFVGLGLWAMADPRGFFDGVATFEPYNQHFIQDIGAFMGGLGVVLLLAVGLRFLDALGVALLGAGVGSGLHTVSHVVGRGLGGDPAVDIVTQAAITVLLLAAGAVRWRQRAAGAPPAREPTTAPVPTDRTAE